MPVTANLIEDWLDGARSQVNEQQFRFLQLVADRLMVESGLKAAVDSMRAGEGAEPLRYLLHGPPGTGKSHVCKLVKELFALVNMNEGIDYQFVAFQATNAVDLAGDTIHHAFSLNPRKHSDEPMKPDVAKRMAMWRWLFIDEISLVPANLLARAEHRLQEVKPQTDEFKFSSSDHDQIARPFAGINVVFIGDFKQLPPVQGGYLADVPQAHQIGPGSASKASDPLADAGRKLMWEDAQGLIELTERERCKDEWWNQVTDEFGGRKAHRGDIALSAWKARRRLPPPSSRACFSAKSHYWAQRPAAARTQVPRSPRHCRQQRRQVPDQQRQGQEARAGYRCRAQVGHCKGCGFVGDFAKPDVRQRPQAQAPWLHDWKTG